MTIREAITKAYALFGERKTEELILVDCLSEVDGRIKTELIDLYEGGEQIAFKPYNHKEDMDKELLVPHPYDEMYVYYLLRYMNLLADEILRANNMQDEFQNVLARYRAYYVRTHMPKNKGGFKL